ncbi:folate/biopterin transporter subfamily protein [Toxoplasma gondii VAND]|uniref:Folate/biopterin transporter subfamily protein n=1 Tax=Toxoplasma gondii VAND TaxID=933077 RepID=A0A086QDV3_TOXGO|nr:folate/biopterin transporter subfamily protein [Toxoplasma gondii VAND]
MARMKAVLCARQWCRRLSPLRLVDFVHSVRRDVGLEFTLMLLSTYVGVKGFLYILATDSLLPFMKDLGYDGLVYQRTVTLAYVPWGMKGLIGLLSDALPVGGYHKRFYMLAASLSGVASLVCLLCLARETARHAAWLIGLLFFCVHVQIATVDLMCEGMYSQVMVAKPRVGANLVTFVNACTTVGAFVGRIIVGPVSDRFGARPLFLVALPVALQSLLPIALNYLMEERVRPGCTLLTEKLRDHKKVFLMAFAVAAGASGVAVLTLVGGRGTTYILPYCGVVSVLLVVLCAVCLPPQLAKCNVFFFLDRILHVSISGALDFFYTASPACVPDGPHFDYTYYSTYTAVAGTLATWLGLVLFQLALSSWTYRSIFWLTSAVRILASLFDYVMTTRLNLRLGIPDKFMYLFGDAIILSVIGTLSHMPGVILTSRLCPPRIESTVYAILAGISNFGHSVSTLLGIRAIKAANITTTATDGHACNFENLPALVLIAHCVLPMASIPLALFLLPSTPMDESLEHFDSDCMRRESEAGAEAGVSSDEATRDVHRRTVERRTRGGKVAETELALMETRGENRTRARENRTFGACVHHALSTTDDEDSGGYRDEDEFDATRKPRIFGRERIYTDGDVDLGNATTFQVLPVLGDDHEGGDLTDAMGVPVFFPFSRRGQRGGVAAPWKKDGEESGGHEESREKRPQARNARVRRGATGQRPRTSYSLCASDQLSPTDSPRGCFSGQDSELTFAVSSEEDASEGPNADSVRRASADEQGVCVVGHHAVAAEHMRRPFSPFSSSSLSFEEEEERAGRRSGRSAVYEEEDRSEDGERRSTFASDSGRVDGEAGEFGDDEVLFASEDAETTAALPVEHAEENMGKWRRNTEENVSSDSRSTATPPYTKARLPPPSSNLPDRDSPSFLLESETPSAPVSYISTPLSVQSASVSASVSCSSSVRHSPFPSSFTSSSPTDLGWGAGAHRGRREDKSPSGPPLAQAARRADADPSSLGMHAVFSDTFGPRRTFVEETRPQLDLDAEDGSQRSTLGDETASTEDKDLYLFHQTEEER